jgi:hypothetical protein
MNIEKALLKEHSKKQCILIVDYIGNNKDRFSTLMELFFNSGYRITQRASWPMSYCVKKHPGLIRPYFKRLLDNFSNKDIHNAVLRNTVRLLADVEIPKRFHGRIMSICFDFIQLYQVPVAIKVFSLSILHNLSEQYPEIIPELKLLIQEKWDNETPAFRSRARKIMR